MNVRLLVERGRRSSTALWCDLCVCGLCPNRPGLVIVAGDNRVTRPSASGGSWACAGHGMSTALSALCPVGQKADFDVDGRAQGSVRRYNAHAHNPVRGTLVTGMEAPSNLALGMSIVQCPLRNNAKMAALDTVTPSHIISYSRHTSSVTRVGTVTKHVQ